MGEWEVAKDQGAFGLNTSRGPIHEPTYSVVVQLVLAYGPFYKNVKTCGPLPAE